MLCMLADLDAIANTFFINSEICQLFDVNRIDHAQKSFVSMTIVQYTFCITLRSCDGCSACVIIAYICYCLSYCMAE